METEILYDPGERLIEQMKELNQFLNKILMELKNEKQRKIILQNKQ